MFFVGIFPPEYALPKDRAGENIHLKPALADDLPAAQCEKKLTEVVPATKP